MQKKRIIYPYLGDKSPIKLGEINLDPPTSMGKIRLSVTLYTSGHVELTFIHGPRGEIVKTPNSTQT